MFERRSPSGGLAVFAILVLAVLSLVNHPERYEKEPPFTTKQRAQTITEPISPFLPQRLLTVFGLESSGTNFVTSLLELSTNTSQRQIYIGRSDNSSQLPGRKYELQHISMPWGFFCREGPLEVVPVLYPALCIHMVEHLIERFGAAAAGPPGDMPPECHDFGFAVGEKDVIYKKRFFVNITSHILWYRERGVDARAILVVRDQNIGSLARSMGHCPIPKAREQEEKLGVQLLHEAMEAIPDQVTILSYETLLMLGLPYLNSILQELEIPLLSNAPQGFQRTIYPLARAHEKAIR